MSSEAVAAIVGALGASAIGAVVLIISTKMNLAHAIMMAKEERVSRAKDKERTILMEMYTDALFICNGLADRACKKPPEREGVDEVVRMVSKLEMVADESVIQAAMSVAKLSTEMAVMGPFRFEKAISNEQALERRKWFMDQGLHKQFCDRIVILRDLMRKHLDVLRETKTPPAF